MTIKARAGVEKRTFFRHHPDKRDNLLEAQAVLVTTLMSSITEASARLGPHDALFRTVRSFGRLLAPSRTSFPSRVARPYR
ncbi:MAG: hypothetical protein ACRYG8_16785 [Janthinobacterium lividum]